MLTTSNLGLTVWNLTSDSFNYSQLQTNWNLIDAHDHSQGKGLQVGTAGIVPGSITQTLMAANSVGAPQINNNSVGTSALQNGAVGTAQIATAAVTTNNIFPGSIKDITLDATLIPLGTITQWWRPTGSTLTPGGFWEIMDGRPWSQIVNGWALTTGNIPDTRGYFTQGADLLGVQASSIGTVAGQNTIDFTHTHIDAGHSHTVPDHLHAINHDGAHYHQWQGGLSVWARANAFPIGLTVEDWKGQQTQNNLYSLYINNLNSNPAWAANQYQDAVANMDNAGDHTHGGSTASDPGWNLQTGISSPITSSSGLSRIDCRPSNISFVYIMRCR